MCTTCGCGNAEARIEGKSIPEPLERGAGRRIPRSGRLSASHTDTCKSRPKRAANPHAWRRCRGGGHCHQHQDGTWHRHGHDDETVQEAPTRAADARTSATHPAPSASRMIRVERDLLAKNDAIAAANRRFFDDRGMFALNLVSSPGSGKTTLLVKTISAWQGRTPVAVIEGDQQTSRDADRVREAGARAVQINTGKGCHLDAQMVASALSQLGLADDSLLLIENVGNLVCPAAFDLGEAHKVVILSVTEGDDKPLKYPDMFHAADLLVLNKIDLLPHVDFDVDAAIGYARRVRPGIEVILVSARTGEGFCRLARLARAWHPDGCRAPRERRRSAASAHRRGRIRARAFGCVIVARRPMDRGSAVDVIAAPAPTKRRRFDVQGVVQGVGFRPFVYRLAHELALAGWVNNDGAGVTIEVEGDPSHIDAMKQRLTPGRASARPDRPHRRA